MGETVRDVGIYSIKSRLLWYALLIVLPLILMGSLLYPSLSVSFSTFTLYFIKIVLFELQPLMKVR